MNEAHKAFIKEAEEEEAKTSPSGMPTVPAVLGELRKIMPKDTTILSEAISNYRKSFRAFSRCGRQNGLTKPFV